MALRLSDQLHALERRLVQRARQVSVLEEFGLTHTEYRFLEKELSGLFQQSPTQAFTTLQGAARHSTAAFLTLVGVYRYGRGTAVGEYWPLVADALRVRAAPQGDLGRLVERVVRIGGLASFPKAEGARRFVDLILLHGGIPNGCLDNYFDRVLRHARASVPGRETIAAVLEPSEQRYLLKPVARYLQYGGDVAADFVERTADLVAFDHRLRIAQPPLEGVLNNVAAAVGLPVRVVKQYRDWLCQDGAGDQRAVVQTGGHAWRRPTLRFGTLQYAPVIDLPAQTVSEETVTGRWTLGHGADVTVFDAPAWKRSDGRWTEPAVHSVASPQTHYDVGWACAEGSARWSLPGISPRAPLLAFHGRDGEPVDVAEGLPRDMLWIVRPADYPFACDGAVLLEHSVQLAGAWSGYTAERWDLTPSTASPRIGQVALTLRVEGDVRPHLGDAPLRGVTTAGAAVFASWPTLVIPRARPDESLTPWSLRWQSEGAEGTASLADLADDTGTGWKVDLSGADLPTLVPLTVRLRGPLGRSARFTLSVWEGLDVGGASRLALPDADGPSAVALTVVLPSGLTLRTIEGGTIGEAAGQIRIDAGPETNAVRLHVHGAGNVLDVEIPRLRSHLYDAGTEGPSTALATAGRLHVQGDWLDAASIPRVVFFSGLEGGTVDALEADFGDGDRMACPRAAGRADVFGLAELAQAATARRRGRARLWAHVGRRQASVGDWHARLGFQGLRVIAVEDSEGVTVRARWDTGRLVDGVQVRLWSIWTPWDTPLAAPVVADGPAACSARFESVPAGRYLAEFVVEDPWAPAPQRRPPTTSPDVAPLGVGSAESQAERLQSGTGARAGVMRMLAAEGDPAGRSRAWREACSAADAADVPLLLSVAGIDAGDELWGRLALAQRERLFDALKPVAARERASIVAALDAEAPQDIAAYAVALGYFDARPQDWGGTWDPLALCGLTHELRNDPARLAHVADRLGLLTRETQGDDDQADEVSLDDLRRVRSPFGSPPQEAMATFPPDVIRALRDGLGLVPGGPLSADAQALGYADWLLARPTDGGASDRLAGEARSLRDELRKLQAAEPERLGLAVAHALGREHALATGGDAPAWLNVPFAVGAAAVLLRAQALDATALKMLKGRGAWVRGVALQALHVAPGLFAHDLCWAHLQLLPAS